MIEKETHPPRQKMKYSYEDFPRWLKLVENHALRDLKLGISAREILSQVFKDLWRFEKSTRKRPIPPRGPAEGGAVAEPPTTQTKTKVKKFWRTYARQTRD